MDDFTGRLYAGPRSGARARRGSADLYDLALKHKDRCHRTLADYADLKRRMGRIGGAVKLYREAVKAAPDHREYKEMLREAQKELSAAPN